MTAEDSHIGSSPIAGGTSPTQKTRLKERLGVSEEVLTDAVDLYEEVVQAEAGPYHEEALPIAVLYIAIRQQGVARNIEEVASAADVSPRRVYRAAQYVSDELEQGIPPAAPEIYVARLAEEVDLSEELEHEALRILSEAKAADYHSGRNPEGVAASAVYAAVTLHDGPVTQRELAAATSVNVRTIRYGYERMLELAKSPDDDSS